MADLSQEWASDLALGPTGGLAMVDGPMLTRQRLIRRLLTNPGDYIWHPDYGAGLGRFVGGPVDQAAIAAVVRAQATMEAKVSAVLSVSVSGDGIGGVGVAIQYLDASDATATRTLGLTVTASGYSAS